MKTHLSYGEIVAKLSAHLYLDYDAAASIHQIFVDLDEECEDLSSLCADAARVFDQMEDLCSDYFIDWSEALECYADVLKDFLLHGQKPSLVDMVVMTSQCIGYQSKGNYSIH